MFFYYFLIWATPHKECLTALHVICLQIFRHTSQKCSLIHKVLTPLFVSSDKKSDCASAAQSLCGVAYDKNVPRGTFFVLPIFVYKTNSTYRAFKLIALYAELILFIIYNKIAANFRNP